MTSPTDLPGTPDIPIPVTLARLGALLQPDGWVLDTSGGVLRRRWPHMEISLTLREGDGLLMLFQGTGTGEGIPLDRARAVEAFVNDWHRDRIWPTIVVTTTETVRVHTHVGIDATAGFTATQLGDNMRIGIGTTHQCFAALAEAGIVRAGGSAHPDAG